MFLELGKCLRVAGEPGFGEVLVRFNLPFLDESEVSIGTHIVVVVQSNSRHKILAVFPLNKNKLSFDNPIIFFGIRNSLALA